jgi:hypothetical protein
MKKSSKAERREAAMKKAKKNKKILMCVCASVAIAIAALIVFAVTRPTIDSRVYTTGAQSVALFDDGRFRFTDCRLARAGTYTETINGDVTTVAFVHRRNTFYGRIANDVLTIPQEWDAGKGHSPHLRLQ